MDTNPLPFTVSVFETIKAVCIIMKVLWEAFKVILLLLLLLLLPNKKEEWYAILLSKRTCKTPPPKESRSANKSSSSSSSFYHEYEYTYRYYDYCRVNREGQEMARSPRRCRTILPSTALLASKRLSSDQVRIMASEMDGWMDGRDLVESRVNNRVV